MDSFKSQEINQACKAAEKFSKLFYDTLQQRRHMISTFYMEDATLVWNGNAVRGKNAVTQFYEQLPSSKIELKTLDSQPVLGIAVNNQTTILVHIGGTIIFQDKPSSTFFQVFMLTAEGTSWKILNDVFRLQDNL